MVVMINQKCGSCGKSLTGGYVQNYSGIGQPFVECSRCGSLNNNSGHVNEWKVMSGSDKALFYLEHIFSVLMRNALLMFFICMGLAVMIEFDSDVTFIGVSIAIYACMVSFGLFRFFVLVGRAINASNARMADPEYVAKLTGLGLAR
ncbi:MAG: hypothetical protein IPK75_06000 [Acidobacteria bacterium]|nr:hypothetical protein [Acidobacteriota bacterium]